MASFSVPCPKVSPVLAASSQSTQQRHRIASFPRSESRSNPALVKVTQSQVGRGRAQSEVFKVAVEKNSNANPALEAAVFMKSDGQPEVPDASISAFISQVVDLVKLVDSRDIVELELKQMDCELLIRKKEALPQPSTPAPVYYSSHPTQQAMQYPPTSAPAPVASVPSPPASTPAPIAPAKPKSSHPPFKCPMAGNFYRSSAPGAPPFVKVGDKVQKGQVLCIIEAMKLMNEIEADHAGTVVEILADDGKPVSVDTPLFIIAP